jgi:hypothetical protein
MRDQRAEYFRELGESDRPRVYLRGADPEDERKQWLFEVVEDDDGRRVAIKQIEIEPSGVSYRYWWRHLEDDHGFLTDQTLDRWDADAVSEISREDFHRNWNS